MKEICERLKDDPRLQLMIVCGKNEVLFEQLLLKYRDYKNITIYGYVTEMAELLKVATCVITKPGGIILSEAMAMKTPIVLPKATPGQEKENARFFQQQGAALWNEKLEQLVVETKQLLSDDSKLNEMKQALANLYFPRSTEAITTDILQDYDCRRVNDQLLKVK